MESLLHSHSKHPSYKSILFKYKKQSLFPQSSVYAAPVLLQNLPKAWGGGMLLSPHTVTPTPGASPDGHRVGNPRSKERNMLRSTWWWTQGCSELCQRPSDLPISRESGPGRGACLLNPVPWETEIGDMSLPIISFTEKQEKEWLVTFVWLTIWYWMASTISKMFFPFQFSVKVNAVLKAWS